jgi:hypothetical protein
MTKTIALAGLLVLGLFSISADAQKSVRLDKAPAAFKVFFEKFRSAVARGDKATVASMTQFPFQYGFDAGDEGTWTRAQFTRKYNDIFGGERKVFAQKNPLFYSEAGSYDLATNDASHYSFVKQGNSYKFTSYIVEP